MHRRFPMLWLTCVAAGFALQSCCHCPKPKPEAARTNLTEPFPLPDIRADVDELWAQMERRQRRIPEPPTGPPNARGCTIFVTGSFLAEPRRLKTELYWSDPLDAQMTTNAFTVTFGEHSLRGVGQTLTLDGTNVARMPLGLTNIEVFVTNFTLLVLGDGTAVLNRELASDQRQASSPKSPQAQEARRTPEDLTLTLALVHDPGEPIPWGGPPGEWIFVLNGVSGYKTVNGLKSALRELPKGSRLTWDPGCFRIGGEPLLNSAEEMCQFEEFCKSIGIKFVLVPSG
jgi:hypothetical protein